MGLACQARDTLFADNARKDIWVGPHLCLFESFYIGSIHMWKQRGSVVRVGDLNAERPGFKSPTRTTE